MKLCSACLLGIACRYDGLSKPNPKIISMGKAGILIPICPEQLGGLSTPRLPAEIRGGSGADVLEEKARVVNSEGLDISGNFIRGAVEVLKIARLYNVKEVILKQRSPSCGVGEIYDGFFCGRVVKGDGATAALLKKYGIRVLSEEDV